MQVNFTGIKDPKILLKRQGVLSPYGSPTEMRVHTIRMNCFLTDKNGNPDLSELKRVTSKAPYLKNKFENFTENDLLRIDISPSPKPQDFGYSLKFNGEEVQQWDTSIFGICTFLCSITKNLLKSRLETPEMKKYIKAINIVADKIGKESLKYVD